MVNKMVANNDSRYHPEIYEVELNRESFLRNKSATRFEYTNLFGEIRFTVQEDVVELFKKTTLGHVIGIPNIKSSLIRTSDTDMSQALNKGSYEEKQFTNSKNIRDFVERLSK